DLSCADTHLARFGLNKWTAQPCDFVRFPPQEDRSYIFALLIGDPAALTSGITIADECCNNFRDESFEALVPAVFLSVKRTMASHDPAHVAGAWTPQQMGHLRRGGLAQRGFDSAHRGDHPLLIRNRQGAEHRADLFL